MPKLAHIDLVVLLCDFVGHVVPDQFPELFDL